MDGQVEQSDLVVENEMYEVNFFPEGIFDALCAIAILIANVVIFINVLSSPHLRRQRRHLLVLNFSAADLMSAVVICFGAKEHITRVPAISPLGWYIAKIYLVYIWRSVISLNILALYWSNIARMRSARSSYQEKAWFTVLLMAIPWIFALSVVVPMVVILCPFHLSCTLSRRGIMFLVFFILPNLVSVVAMIAALRVYADVRTKKAIYQECTESLLGEDTLGAAAHQAGAEGKAPKERTPAAECCEKTAATGEEPREGREPAPAPAFTPLVPSTALLPPPTGAPQHSCPSFTSPAAGAHLGESDLQGTSTKDVKSPAAVDFPKAEVIYTFLSLLLCIVPLFATAFCAMVESVFMATQLSLLLFPLRAVVTPWVWMVRPDYRSHFLSLLRHLCCSRA